jgi:hypothetical protein
MLFEASEASVDAGAATVLSKDNLNMLNPADFGGDRLLPFERFVILISSGYNFPCLIKK